MAISVLNVTTAAVATASASPSVTIPATTAGSVLVAFYVDGNASATLSSVAATGGTWTSKQTDGGGTSAWGFLTGVTAGTTGVTFNQSTSDAPTVVIYEVSGLSTTVDVMLTPPHDTASGTTVTSGGITTTNAVDLLIGCCVGFPVAGGTNTTTWTNSGNSTGYNDVATRVNTAQFNTFLHTGYQVLAATGAHGYNLTTSQSCGTAVFVVAIQATAAGNVTITDTPAVARAVATAATVSTGVTITDTPSVARGVSTTATVSTGVDVTVADTPSVARAVATSATVSTGVTIADRPAVARAVATRATVSTSAVPGVPWLAQYVTGYIIACYLGFGVDPTTDPSTWVMTDVSSLVLQDTGFTVTEGMQDEQQTSTSSVCTLTFKNFSGDLSTRRPRSKWWPYVTMGLPLLLQIVDPVTGVATQFEGYIDEMDQEYDSTGKFATVAVTAHGIMSNLAQGKPPLQSAPYQYLSRLTGTVPVASWTLEEGRLVTGATPLYGPGLLRPYVGIHPSGAVVSYPQWGEGTLAPWLPAVVSPSASSGMTILWSPVVMPANPTTWSVDLAYASGSDGADSGIDINPSYLGGSLGWPQLTISPSVGQVSVTLNGAPEVITDVPSLFDGLVHNIRWTAAQSGGNVTWTVHVDTLSVNSGTATTFTLPQMTRIALFAAAGSAGIANGYLSVWTNAVALADMVDAIQGHAGETATDRMRRLCGENNIAFDCSSESLRTMGPQPVQTLSAHLRDAEAVDGGTIRDGFGIFLCALNDRYNVAATMAPALTDLVGPFGPTESTTYLRNDVVASQPNGSSSEYIQPAGEPYAATGPGGVVFGQSELIVNTETADVLPLRAQWAVHEGTVDEDRYARIPINLARRPSLIRSWLACDIGSRITVASNYDVGGRPADATVLGWTFTMSTFVAMVTANTTPYVKYILAEVDDPTTARVTASNAKLTAAITAVATSVQVTVSSLWTTDPAEFPMLLNLDGEGPVTCTAISGSSLPTQTFTIARGADACTHKINGRVNIWRPGVVGLVGA